MTIHVAHSPDSDDAFMFYALADGKIDTEGSPTSTSCRTSRSLNQRAMRGELEVTAVSIHAYAYLSDRYALLPHGASMGDRYGPRLVARAPATRADVKGKRIAIPGPLTSAYLALSSTSRISPGPHAVRRRSRTRVVTARSTWGSSSMKASSPSPNAGFTSSPTWANGGSRRPGLPLPLGGNVVRKDLGADLTQQDFAPSSRQHRVWIGTPDERARPRHAVRPRPRPLQGRHLRRHVRQRLDPRLRPAGREAVRFFERGVDAGVIDRNVTIEFVDD